MANWFTALFRPHTVLTDAQRTTAIHIIGQPGAGKSRALESWAWQDITSGHGVAVVDPAGDLFANLLARVARRPNLWSRIILVDPCDEKRVTRLNPLTAMHGANAERIALFMTDVVVRLWKLDPTSAPRAVWLMTNTFLALAALKLTLLDLPKFLLVKSFRDSLLPKLPPNLHLVRTYFTQEFPKSPGGARQWALPILNKLGGLLFDSDIRLMVSGSPSVDFRKAMDERMVLLVNLPKGTLGEDLSSLMAAFVVAMFQKAALSRADTQLGITGVRDPYFLYLDEFQNYTTENINDILAESRKYGLSLVLAHQYLDQLSPTLKSAVLSTSGTLACFRVGADDAQQLAKYVFPGMDYQQPKEMQFSLGRAGAFSQINVDERITGVGWDRLAQRLTNQDPRWFWMRRKGNHPPLYLRTADTTPPAMMPELAAQIGQLRDLSGKTYGVEKAVAQRLQEANTLSEETEVKVKKKRGRPKKTEQKQST